MPSAKKRYTLLIKPVSNSWLLVRVWCEFLFPPSMFFIGPNRQLHPSFGAPSLLAPGCICPLSHLPAATADELPQPYILVWFAVLSLCYSYWHGLPYLGSVGAKSGPCGGCGSISNISWSIVSRVKREEYSSAKYHNNDVIFMKNLVYMAN